MSEFKALVFPMFDSSCFEREILSQSVITYICNELAQAGGNIYCTGSFCSLPDYARVAELPADSLLSAFFNGSACQMGLVFFAPTPTVTAGELLNLLRGGEIEPVCLRAGKVPLAVAGKCADLQRLALSELGGLPFIESDAPVAQSSASVYMAQEVLRTRINSAHIARGVFMTDPASAFISPATELAPGCEILPGCIIYGKSRVGPGCVIGPNCLLHSAELGEGVRVNASQVFDSSIGRGTTVGPFSYIRPGCEIGENVKIGDFVELKKSIIGNGTKISHLAYMADCELGRRVNVGCGAVTVNYDGKSKHKTVVGDDSFIGCNVNLVAPLTIGNDAYLAAGSTITEPVESEALAIARVRQSVKPQWVARRRSEGKL